MSGNKISCSGVFTWTESSPSTLWLELSSWNRTQTGQRGMSHDVASNGEWSVHNELGRIGKEVVVSRTELLSLYLFEGTEEKHRSESEQRRSEPRLETRTSRILNMDAIGPRFFHFSRWNNRARLRGNVSAFHTKECSGCVRYKVGQITGHLDRMFPWYAPVSINYFLYVK
jgi:hypothetical protein